MSENENKVCPVSCKIEHHAMMFAFLAKHAIELCGDAGKEAILAGTHRGLSIRRINLREYWKAPPKSRSQPRRKAPEPSRYKGACL